ncbi:calcium-binding protein [Actinoplanes sp. NBRC 101535]|uniref:calcium-binding protein n=1 Tax=Actinoplanes sp. NBRC 101535 TaxID=3032196 RepID=UPI0024A1E9B1|nr:calcium-binding protein [Actinoplanes sp. NBRC 101535]GLY05183.1 hypothetical protein Acsp01_55620 [Actinoplanes sp. NBRC 101535]
MTPRVRTSWLVRAGAILLATTAAGLLAGTPAKAASTGSVKSVGNVVTFTAGKGQTNGVTITRSGTTITVDDRVKVKAGKGCTAVKGDSTKAKCRITKSGRDPDLIVHLGDRSDTLVNKTDISMTAYGGSGKDKLTGGSTTDRLHGQGGADRLFGKSGDDWLYGGTGNDELHGGSMEDILMAGPGNDTLWGDGHKDMLDGGTGADEIHGGTGADTVRYWGRTAAVSVSLDGRKRDDGQAGEHDTVHRDVENVVGGDGDDRITGDSGNNHIQSGAGDDVIHAGAGDDYINGGDGEDRMYGEAGDDSLYAADGDLKGKPDLVDGGTGRDDCYFKPTVDTVVSCEIEYHY